MHRIAAILLAALVAGCAEDPAANGPVARSVVLFTVDTLRADHVGAAGYTLRPTPAMDELAAESVWFTAAYSQATLTNSALTSILTGLLPLHHGVHTQAEVPVAVAPVQLVAQASGIATGSFIANMCKLQHVPRTVYSMGWDRTFCGMFLEEGAEREQWEWDVAVVDAAVQWMAEQSGPFFCWIHLMDPHAEHRPEPSLWDYAADPPREKYAQYDFYAGFEERREMLPPAELDRLMALYGAEVAGADAQLRRVMTFLDQLEDGESTALVFSADHGEELFETWSRYDHGLSLTEGVLRVPLMVRAPGLAPRRVDDPVESLQIAPTVLDLFDLEPPADLSGPSLLGATPSRGHAASFATNDVITIRTSDLRYWWRNPRARIDRPADAAPWRMEGFGFVELEQAVRYPRSRTGYPIDELSRDEVASRQSVERMRKIALDLARQAASAKRGEKIEDPEVLRMLDELGYTDAER